MLTPALQAAIAFAKRRRASEVEPDDILTVCLLSASRLGVARFGALAVDLEPLGIDWLTAPAPPSDDAKVAYSDATVALLDVAAAIARADQAKCPRVAHLLAAFTRIPPAPLWTRMAVGSGAWRAALAEWDQIPVEASPHSDSYLSPEQAAELLGVHHQTIRGYIRSGKLAALRIAGERAVRIRRASLDQLLEPLTIAESE
jgi:excisionase family DNA binding protein